MRTIVLAALFVLAFAACGGADDHPAANTASEAPLAPTKSVYDPPTLCHRVCVAAGFDFGEWRPDLCPADQACAVPCVCGYTSPVGYPPTSQEMPSR